MTRFVHRLSLTLYFLIIILAIVVLTYAGYSYYHLPIEHRYDDPVIYHIFNPGGTVGHNLGIYGTILIVVGLFGYMARKRMKIFSGIGLLKYWLEFHIFLCTLGSVLVLFHTSFKFGGIVSIGFWSLVIVWVSGVIGRFIYLQIPRSIEGRELSLQEINDIKDELNLVLLNKYQIDFSTIKSSKFSKIKLELISRNISGKDFKKVRKLIRDERKISKRIERLAMMQNLFKYWHVAHLPFALIMLIIMVIHVVVVLYFVQILNLWIK
ncbi:MAG: hypothetical protein PHS84_04685 [Paludibacter sp.]|jgi:hypothetical protein|nr:hypothetical protein [Paludibacter sp.]